MTVRIRGNITDEQLKNQVIVTTSKTQNRHKKYSHNCLAILTNCLNFTLVVTLKTGPSTRLMPLEL